MNSDITAQRCVLWGDFARRESAINVLPLVFAYPTVSQCTIGCWLIRVRQPQKDMVARIPVDPADAECSRRRFVISLAL